MVNEGREVGGKGIEDKGAGTGNADDMDMEHEMRLNRLSLVSE